MTTYATGEGTRRYAARFASTAAAGNYREPASCATPAEPGPVMSSIGIGTYLGAPDTATDRFLHCGGGGRGGRRHQRHRFRD